MEPINGKKQLLTRLSIARALSLLLLSITTFVVVDPSAKQMAVRFFGEGSNIVPIVRAMIVVIVCGSVDGVLETFINAIDSSTKSETKSRVYKFLWVGAIVWLLASATFTYWSTPLISSLSTSYVLSKGDSTKAIIASTVEIQKAQQAQTNTQNQLAIQSRKDAIQSARIDSAAWVQKAIASAPSKSWKDDYYSAIGNPKHWFWTCDSGSKGCPVEYVEYRDKIRTAMSKGSTKVANAKMQVVEIRDVSTKVSDNFLPIIDNLVEQDSINQSRATEIQASVTKAIIGIEVMAGVSIVVITIILWGIKQDNNLMGYDTSIPSVFTAIEMASTKAGGLFWALFTGILAMIDPPKIHRSMQLAGKWLHFKTVGKIERWEDKTEATEKALAESRQAEKKARMEAEQARQEAERQKRDAAIARQKEEYERRQYEYARQELDRKQRQEQQDRDKMEKKQRQIKKAKASTDKGSSASVGNLSHISAKLSKGILIVEYSGKVVEYDKTRQKQLKDFLSKCYARSLDKDTKESTRAKNKTKYDKAKLALQKAGASFDEDSKSAKVSIDLENVKW